VPPESATEETTGTTQRAAIEGWFTLDPQAPALLGSHCASCGSYAFPKESFSCRNPHCPAPTGRLEEVTLSRRGRLWSFTDNRYAPPPPYVAGDPFEPYAIAAVELEREKLVVLGQVARGIGVDRLEVGMEMELVLETLFEDGDGTHLVWKWRPTA
jgi:uncharacterized OB-fold protein